MAAINIERPDEFNAIVLHCLKQVESNDK